MDFEIVRQQIGAGNLMAVGARAFVADEAARSLMFQVGSKRTLLEKVIVTLEPSDYYSVRYVAIRRKDCTCIKDETFDAVTTENLGGMARKLGDST